MTDSVSNIITIDQARAAKESSNGQRLAALPQVNGIGLTTNAAGYALKVNLLEPVTDLPDQIDGVPVLADLVGPVSPC